MSLSADVWLIILCALVLANLPFVLDRPLAAWPWKSLAPSNGARTAGRGARPGAARAGNTGVSARGSAGTPARGDAGTTPERVSQALQADSAATAAAVPVEVAGDRDGAGRRWLRSAGYLAGIVLWSWGTLRLVGGSFAGGGGTTGLFVLKLLASGILAVLLLAWPGWGGRRGPGGAQADGGARVSGGAHGGARVSSGARVQGKSFLDRLLEVLVGYVLVGTLGFSLELNRGNAFPQRWEFYAVTLALFLVLAYPGFVWRYMLRRRRG